MELMQKLAAGLDTTMVFNAIIRQFPIKEGMITLRGKDEKGNMANWLNLDLIPQIRPLIFGVMSRIEGEVLGAVSIVKTLPEVVDINIAAIPEHLYIVVLHAPPGILLGDGKEDTLLFTGDVWWVRGGVPASIKNNSDEASMVLLIWATPNGPATYLPPEG